MEQNKTGLIFENIVPKNLNKSSRKINFHDENDIILDSKKNEARKFAKKINLLFFIFSLSFIVFISIKLIKLSINVQHNSISKTKIIKIPRGKIYDRNSEVIATSINTKDLYIDTKKILNKPDLTKRLKAIFEKKSKINDLLKSNKYVLIKKFLSPSEINELREIGDPSIIFQNSQKRVYPQHNIFSHITGFKIEKLKSKIEKNADERLSFGEDVWLTVDLKVQNIVRDELIKGLKLFNAKSALAIVMDVNNGEIISMVSLPDFDPNYPKTIKAFTENNLATEARYEMGSTLKMFNAALAYEFNKTLINKTFTIKNGYQITNEKIIKDDHINLETINFNQAFIHSSNIASVEMIDEIGISNQKQLFKKVGLTSNLKINGLNVVPNKEPNIWNETSSKFMSYGYGISISPMSLVASFSTLVNGGYKINPKIFKDHKSDERERVLSKKTSQKINYLLEKIVEKGTGKRAQVPGLKLGGKTGTSKKVENGEYSEEKVITSFIGAFPINKPNYLTFVLFDEPQRNTGISLENFGSNTAAPTFSKIVKKISPILNKNNYHRYSNNKVSQK